jgi:hypothetical protein
MPIATIPPGAFGPPNVFGPPEGATGIDPWPALLNWEPGADASSYIVALSTSQQDLIAGGPSSSVQTQTVALEFVVSEPGVDGVHPPPLTRASFTLAPDTTYYWRTRDADGRYQEWSPVRSFTTDARKTTLTSPSSGASVDPWQLQLSWQAVGGATGYDVSGPKPGVTTHVTTNSITVDLTGGGSFQWKVRAVSGQLHGADSDTRSFTTQHPSTKLVAPANQAVVSPWAIALSWEAVHGASGYLVETTGAGGAFTSLGPVSGTSTTTNVAPGVTAPVQWRVTPLGPTSTSPPERGVTTGAWSFTADYGKTVATPESPAQGAYVTFDAPVLFTWAAVHGAVQYQLLLGAKGQPPTPYPAVNALQLRVSNLPPNIPTGYTWQTRAVGPSGYLGQLSPLFTYLPNSQPPVNPSPPNGAKNVPLGPVELTWQDSNAPEGYVLTLSPGGPTSLPLALQSYRANLTEPGTTYHWTVVAKGHPDVSSAFQLSTVPVHHLVLELGLGTAAKQAVTKLTTVTWAVSGHGFSSPTVNGTINSNTPSASAEVTVSSDPQGTWQITCTVDFDFSYYEPDIDTQKGSTTLTSTPPTSQAWLTTADLRVSFQLDFNPPTIANPNPPPIFTLTHQA